MNAVEAYQKLVDRMKEVSYVGGATSLLSWDEETYLPEKGRRYRGEQKAFLSGWMHERFVDSQVGKWIEVCQNSIEKLSDLEKTNVREWGKDYHRATALSKELVEAFEKARSETHHLWIEARKNSDYRRFAPGLERLVDLSKQRAEAWGYQETAYDALLEENEPGMRVADLAPLFKNLKESLTQIVPRACESSQKNSVLLPPAEYSIEHQQKLNQEVARAIGFDFQAGRIDTTVHPFCSGIGEGDCRLTTRYATDQFLTSLYGVLHEAGHGMYEQGFLEESTGTPMAQAVSLGIHESQSRFWENHIGRSRSFWEWLYPRVIHYFPHLKSVSCDQLYRHVNRVQPSLIRVEADPVTYDFHIILRFEVEQRLFSGDLKVSEIPGYWNETFRAMTGIQVPNDANGVLQDVHWSWGLFGYFPTYTLGNLNAAQLAQAMRKDLGDIESRVEKGEFASILEWLRLRIHQKGRALSPQELMKSATGSHTAPRDHLHYLQEKFVNL